MVLVHPRVILEPGTRGEHRLGTWVPEWKPESTIVNNTCSAGRLAIREQFGTHVKKKQGYIKGSLSIIGSDLQYVGKLS